MRYIYRFQIRTYGMELGVEHPLMFMLRSLASRRRLGGVVLADLVRDSLQLCRAPLLHIVCSVRKGVEREATWRGGADRVGKEEIGG